MIIDWSKDALDEALDAFAEARIYTSDVKAMEIALDKAVDVDRLLERNQKSALAHGRLCRREALEDAARELERLGAHGEAAAVRRLSEPHP